MTDRAAVPAGPIDGEIIKLGQLTLHFYATSEHTGGHADVFEVCVPQGAHVPVAHHHIEVDEVVYILEGTLTYTLGGVPHVLQAGDRLFAPKGVVHHFANLHA